MDKDNDRYYCKECKKVFKLGGYSKHMMFSHNKKFSQISGVRALTATEIDRTELLKRRWQMRGGSGKKRQAVVVPIRPSVDMGLCENTFVNLDIVPEKDLSCWEDISLGSVESIWIDPFPIQPELNQSSSDIEELGFLPPWDAVVTPVTAVDLTPLVAVEPLNFQMDIPQYQQLLREGASTFAYNWIGNAPRVLDEQEINWVIAAAQSAHQTASILLAAVDEVFSHRRHLRERGRDFLTGFNPSMTTVDRHHRHRRHREPVMLDNDNVVDSIDPTSVDFESGYILPLHLAISCSSVF